MSFKVGDKVRCVRPDGDGILVKNQIYIVTDSTVGSKGELIMLKGICSPGRNTSYFANRFELVVEEPPKFKVGDRVRCVKKDIFLNVGEVSVGEIYTVAASNIDDSNFCIRVEEVKGAYWMCCFELAGPEEIRVGDVWASNLAISKQHICMPRNAGRNFAMEQMVNGLFNITAMVEAPPTVTKIIHNGTTTITFFSDGKKVITRPSQDDLEKYDPFVGWCVGVVEHLYGGKEKAKKFYKKHAVVQKGTRKAAFVKEEPNLDCKNCLYYQNEILTSPCSICVSSYESSENKWSKPSRWEPKENPDLNAVIAEIKAVEKEQLAYKDCGNCKYDKTYSISNDPCKTCLDDLHCQGKRVTKWEPKEEN